MASVTIVLASGLLLSACDNDSQAEDFENQHSATVQTSVINVPEINKEVKDSLDKYTERIDSISKVAKAASDNVGVMHKKVSDLQDKEKWLWSAFGLAAVAVILALICLIRTINISKRIDRHRREIDELRHDKQSVSPTMVNNPSIPSDYNTLKKRVSDLENKLNKLLTTPNERPDVDREAPKPVVQTSTKSGYFGTPINASEPYFKRLLNTRDSEARFTTEISGKRATYKPIELSSYIGTFVSTDAMRAAIEFSGCNPSEATSMTVVTPGTAEQRNDKWIITKKASIKLR